MRTRKIIVAGLAGLAGASVLALGGAAAAGERPGPELHIVSDKPGAKTDCPHDGGGSPGPGESSRDNL